jgi:murein endopeptidase
VISATALGHLNIGDLVEPTTALSVAHHASRPIASTIDVWMPADDLEQVTGEDYRRVPRYVAYDADF